SRLTPCPILDNPELTEDVIHNTNELAEYVAGTWKMILNEESLRVAFKNLSEAGRLRLKSAAKLRWEQVSKGLSQQTLDALDQGMRRCHLVTEGDEGFENKASLLGYLQGREVSTESIAAGVQYLQGRGGRGTKLHWEQRKDPDAPEYRGHRFDRNDPNSYRF